MGQERNAGAQISRAADWLEVALLAAMFPLFVFPKIDKVCLYLVFPVIWILRWAVEGKDDAGQKGGSVGTGRTIIDLSIAVLAIQIFVACLIVSNIETSLPKISGILYGIFVFYALTRLLDSKKLIRAGTHVFIAGAVSLAAIGLTGMLESRESFVGKAFTFLFKKVPHKNWGFKGAELGLNPNAVAGVMMIFVPLSLVIAAWALRKKRGRGSAFLYLQWLDAVAFAVLSCFFCFVLFLTQSIASWVALGISLWLVLPSWKTKAAGLLPAVAFLFGILVLLPGKMDRDAARQGTPFWKEKIEARYKWWDEGLKAVGEKPITGIGVNQLRMRPGFGYEHSHAHNHMLHTAAELGIPGLVAYLAILVGAGWMCYKVWLQSGVGWIRAAALGLGAGQLAHFIFGMGDSIPLGAKPGVFFWFSLALITAMFNYIKRKEFSVQDPE